MGKCTIYSNSNKLNWNAKGNERIAQNVTNILNTYMYEVAYNRNLGRNPENIDKPLDLCIAAVIEETFDLIKIYEPRASVSDIEYIGLDNDIPILKVVIDIG